MRVDDDNCVREEHESYTLLPVKDYCCDTLARWFSDTFAFAENHEPVVAITIRHGDDDESFDTFDEHMDINNCPFCGARFQCVEQERVTMQHKKVTETVERCAYDEVPAASATTTTEPSHNA